MSQHKQYIVKYEIIQKIYNYLSGIYTISVSEVEEISLDIQNLKEELSDFQKKTPSCKEDKFFFHLQGELLKFKNNFKKSLNLIREIKNNIEG